ncbi:hypothetical protein, partial [Xanthomonas fragariae]|uniref:hypothetical protein n=1 Tax=Xanthomonas fragariae TaxID=48664 RepID=UPI001F48F9AA
CLDAGDGMVILECRAAVTDGTWRLKGIFQGRLMGSMSIRECQTRLRCQPAACPGRGWKRRWQRALAHRASFHLREKIAPSKPGVKRIGAVGHSDDAVANGADLQSC